MRVCILIHAHESLGEQVTVGNVAENMVVTSQFLMSLAHLLRHWMTSRVVWTRSLFALAVLHVFFFTLETATNLRGHLPLSITYVIGASAEQIDES